MSRPFKDEQYVNCNKMIKAFIRAGAAIIVFLGIVLVNTVEADDFDIFAYSGMEIANTDQDRCSPIDVLTILDQLAVFDLLQERFYLRTHPLNHRNILDYPLFLSEWDAPFCKDFNFYFFYNQTSEAKFCGSSTKINSYLAVSQDAFLEKLQAILREIRELSPDLDPNVAIDILALIENFTVQERRTGIMFNYFNRIDEVHINILLPFYYLERNHFANEQVQRDLAEIADQLTTRTASRQEQERLQRCHFISDKLGWGDTRIEIDFPGIELFNFCVRPGIFTTLPTAYSFEKGMQGNTFRQDMKRPLLNLCLLFDEIATRQDISEAQLDSYMFSVLDRLSSILLEAPLGNNGHATIGILSRSKSFLSNFIRRPWADAIKLKSRLSIEYLLPKYKIRSFITKDPAAGFNRDFLDEERASENLAFITQAITDRLFPLALCAYVHPGVIFRSTSRALYNGERWSAFLGTDTWVQTAETITTVKASQCLANQIDVERATLPLAYQGKITGGLAYSRDRGTYGYTLSLNGDTTYASYGIGKDYMVSFNIDIHF